MYEKVIDLSKLDEYDDLTAINKQILNLLRKTLSGEVEGLALFIRCKDEDGATGLDLYLYSDQLDENGRQKVPAPDHIVTAINIVCDSNYVDITSHLN